MLKRFSMNSHPTLMDVAEAAGVSLATASFIVNGKADQHRIGHDTQNRVKAAARQLNYQPNTAAQRMALGMLPDLPPSQVEAPKPQTQSRQVGLVLSTTSRTDILALIPGLEPVLAESDYRLFVSTLPADPAAATAKVTQLLNDCVAGLICCPSVYSAVSATVATRCPVIVLWQGAARAILEAVARPPQAVSRPSQMEDFRSQITESAPVTRPLVVPPTPTPRPVVTPVVPPHTMTPAAAVATPVIVETTPVPVSEPVVTPVAVAVETPTPDSEGTVHEPGSAELRPPGASAQDVDPVSTEIPTSVPEPAVTVETTPVPVSEPVVTPVAVVVETPTPDSEGSLHEPGSAELRPPSAPAQDVNPVSTEIPTSVPEPAVTVETTPVPASEPVVTPEPEVVESPAETREAAPEPAEDSPSGISGSESESASTATPR